MYPMRPTSIAPLSRVNAETTADEVSECRNKHKQQTTAVAWQWKPCDTTGELCELAYRRT